MPLSIFLVALPVTGCGGVDGPTKEQYLSGLNAMCEDFRQREKAIGEPKNIADLVTKGPLVLDAFEQAIADKVGTLKAPDALADQAQRLVDLAEEQREVLAGLVVAARNGNVAKVQALASKNATINGESSAITHDLGADACATGE